MTLNRERNKETGSSAFQVCATVVLTGITVVLFGLMQGCASTQVADGNIVGTADTFDADSTFMSAGADWGTEQQAADFIPGVKYQGVKAIEIAMPYGETTVAYNFDGFEPGQALEILTSVNFDFFMRDSFVYFAYLPGTLDATEGEYPRPHISDKRQYQWIDSVGRFAGEPWPDATEGWETIVGTVTADEEGRATMIMMVNHWTEEPPMVYAYFRNPVARPAEESEGNAEGIE